MRIERSKFTTSPPSPVEAFRRVSSKIGVTKKPMNFNFNDDDSNNRLLDHSSLDQSDDQYEGDILPFNPTGKFVKKPSALTSPLSSLKNPRNMKKALMSRVNAAVEHNGFFGYQDSRDDESNHHLLSRDGQYEDRWFNAGDDDERSALQPKQNDSITKTKPLLPDFSDSDSSESTESSKENKGSESTESSKENKGVTATINTPSSVNEEESLASCFESRKEVKTTPEEVADVKIMGISSTIDLEEGPAVEHVSTELDQNKNIENHIELEGSSSTVDFDDDLSVAETPVNTIEHQSPVEEDSEKKSINLSPTDVKSYASYTRHECPVVVSSSEHGDVILLYPKGFETRTVAEATLSVPSLEKEDESQDLSTMFEAIALADPTLTSGKVVAAEKEQEKTTQSKEGVKTHSEDADDEFVISDDWSEDGSVGNSSDPFGECLVHETVVQNITEHRFEQNTTLIGREKKDKVTREETLATDNDTSSNVGEVCGVQVSSKFPDLETNQLATMSSSSVDLASFNQIWEGSANIESGSDSDEYEESKLSDKKSNDDAALDVSREDMTGISVSDSSDKSDSSKSDDNDSYISLNKYWASEWNDLTCDDIATEVGESFTSVPSEEEEDIQTRDKYATSAEEEDDSVAIEDEEEGSHEFYGCRIVEESGDYSYDSSYRLETITEEGEFSEDEPSMPPSCESCDESKKEDEDVVGTIISEEELVLASKEAEKIDEAMVDVGADESVSLTAEPSNVAKEEVIVVETDDECSSDDEKTNVEEPTAQTNTSNVVEVQKEVLYELWSKIDENQANATAPCHTEEFIEAGNVKDDFDMKQTSVKRHVFTKLFAPVSALVTRRSSGKQDLDLSKAGSKEPTNRSSNQEGICDESNVESEDDRKARELAQFLSAAMMAREQAKMEKATVFAKQLAEIQEAVAMEQELAEIEGGLNYDMRKSNDIVTPVENYSSSYDDDSQIEIIDEEPVATATPAIAASNESKEVEIKNLHELWSKIDEYQASGKSMDSTQVAMVAKVLNSQIEDYTPGNAGKSSPHRLRSPKHAVSVKKRAVAKAKAKKSKYDVSYIETKLIVKNKKAAEASEGMCCDLEPSDIDEPTGVSNHLVEHRASSLPDLEAQQTYESADFDAPTQVYLVPSAMSLDSLASMISADKSSDSLGGVSKGGSDLSKGSLVSKLYSDNADLAETLAVTQYELEKAMKNLENMKMEKEALIATAVRSKPVPAPKSSFEDYFEPDALEENFDVDENEWYEEDLGNRSDLCEI